MLNSQKKNKDWGKGGDKKVRSEGKRETGMEERKRIVGLL